MRKTLATFPLVIGLLALAGAAGAVEVCLDDFCDTLECDLDNGNVITCLWDWTCDGTDDEELIGIFNSSNVTVGGVVTNGLRHHTWSLDLPNRLATVYIFNFAVGSSILVKVDNFKLGDACTEVTAGPSLVSTTAP